MKYVFSVVLTCALASGSFLAGQGEVRVVVGFKTDVDRALLARLGGRAGIDIVSSNGCAATVPAGAIARLRSDPRVSFVEEDGIIELIEPLGGRGGNGGNPPLSKSQQTPWGILRVGGPRSGLGVKIAMIDSGIDLDHPDLAANLRTGVNFVEPDEPPDDDNGHGSHTAGTVAAVDNDLGVVGVAPYASLYPIKVLDRRGFGHPSYLAAALDWTAQNGMNIASMSLGVGWGTSAVETACVEAQAAGVLLIAAGGNLIRSDLAELDSVVAVGATDINDNVADFSIRTEYIELSGPGVDVVSTFKNAGYKTWEGTSMSCPHATGVAAVIWKSLWDSQSNPTNTSVRLELRLRADSLGLDPSQLPDLGYGYGIVRHLQ